MSDTKWLLIDVSCIAYRSMYVMGDLKHEGESTGALFGLFCTVLDLRELFATDRVVWCFDRGYGLRKALAPTYKEGRHRDERHDWVKEAHRLMRRQLYRLRKTYLPSIGFRNILAEEDLEADDMIAAACLSLKKSEEAVIVSSDNDLYQLLSPRVSMWLPNRGSSYTAKSFAEEWGVAPSQWADVKAIAGCSSDNVEGIRGIGPKTAVKFLAGTLKAESKAFKSIISGNDVWRRNLPLVSLPFEGTPTVTLHDDELSESCWKKVMDDLGMTTLRDRAPRRRK